jgi:hypothetical protein
MMINMSSMLVIEAFEFRICFARLTRLSQSDGGQAFRASDFEFNGQAEKQRI